LNDLLIQSAEDLIKKTKWVISDNQSRWELERDGIYDYKDGQIFLGDDLIKPESVTPLL
jgi:hypothetical protein